MTSDAEKKPKRGFLRFLKILGPGLVTGAADDDPSGIATYSQTGALRLGRKYLKPGLTGVTTLLLFIRGETA